MKALVTGGTGFIGSNLIEGLKNDYKIFTPRHSELDIRDSVALRNYIKKNKIKVIAKLILSALLFLAWFFLIQGEYEMITKPELQNDFPVADSASVAFGKQEFPIINGNGDKGDQKTFTHLLIF